MMRIRQAQTHVLDRKKISAAGFRVSFHQSIDMGFHQIEEIADTDRDDCPAATNMFA
jgi:hypothetical protein